jgi:hypothetical protein
LYVLYRFTTKKRVDKFQVIFEKIARSITYKNPDEQESRTPSERSRENSDYEMGKKIGRITGIVMIAAVVIWVAVGGIVWMVKRFASSKSA